MSDNSILNAITVDVEDYFHVSAFAGTIDRNDWRKMECRVEPNTHRILDIFSRRGIKGTFFVLGWVAEHYPKLVRDIFDAGHEVACHGYSHQLVYKQTIDVFREETVKAKNLLEDIVQSEVSGYRAASYSITQDSMWALDVLVEAGFKYDSSIFPIHHDRYGIPGAKTHPHVLNTPHGKELVEFPISTTKLFGVNLPVAGGGYFRLFPYFVTRAGLSKINNRQQQPFVFYLHPWEIDPDQPRVNAPWFSRFRHYNNLEKCEERLSALVRQFQFSTLRDVLIKEGLLKADDNTIKKGAA